ncbi:MAG: hypothetical protein ACC660_05225 [Acidimicrobiales bacterium]
MMFPLRLRLLLALTLVLAACGGSTVVVSGGTVVPDPASDASESFELNFEPDSSDVSDESDEQAGEPSAFAAKSLRKSARTTATAESYRYEMSFSMFISDGSFEIDIAPDRPLAVGAVSGSTQQMSMDLGTVFEDMLPALADGDDADEIAAMFGGDLSMEIIATSTTMYLRAPFLAGLFDGALGPEMPPGLTDMAALADGWGVIDLTQLADFGAGDISGLAGAPAGGAPDQLLEMLQDAGSEVTDLGRETVRGVETTHLRAVVSLLSLLEAQGASTADFGGVDVGAFDLELPFDVYVDDESRVRRLQMALTLDDIAALMPGEAVPPGTDFSFSTTIDLFDFGADIEITLPDESEIVGDFTDLFTELAALGG